MSNRSVLTVIGKDRIGIVADVAVLLARYRLNIINISQQLMEDYFTMIILLDTASCSVPREVMLSVLEEESTRTGLDLRLQDETLFNAVHRI